MHFGLLLQGLAWTRMEFGTKPSTLPRTKRSNPTRTRTHKNHQIGQIGGSGAETQTGRCLTTFTSVK